MQHIDFDRSFIFFFVFIFFVSTEKRCKYKFESHDDAANAGYMKKVLQQYV